MTSIVILIGPPGSGKGTQAGLLSKKLGFYCLETSKLVEAKINDEELVKKNSEVAEAKKLYDTGGLVTPSWVTGLLIEKVRELAKSDTKIVFDGSPRTIYEAENEMPELEKLYGKENIKVIELILSEEESVKRNSVRKICKKSRHPIPATLPGFQNVTKCPEDGSEVITRTLDKPEIIQERYRVYLQETKPVLDSLEKMGYKIIQVNAEQPIEDITKEITFALSQ